MPKTSFAAFWSLHRTPILFPPKAITEEMSSPLTVVDEITNGVPQLASLQAGVHRVRLTQIVPPCCQVAQSLPVESLAITSVSSLLLLIVTGNPVSLVYVS